MKNRTQEYWELVGELSTPPQSLEGSVERARRRARRAAPLRRLTASAASLAAAAAGFVLLVNVFPSFALACSGVPIIRELTAAAAFSPSLSAAVSHDYVQYIGQSQTAEGVTVNLEYAIVDNVQAVFFYRMKGGAQFYTSPAILDAQGKLVGGYSSCSDNCSKENDLHTMTLSFPQESALPDRFTLKMFFKPMQLHDQNEAPSAAPNDGSAAFESPWEDNPDVLCFSFDVALDPSRICQPKLVQVGRWLELDGQRILVDRLELFPTRTILYLDEDGGNTAWLKSLRFRFEDERGSIYDNADGTLTASGKADSQSYLTYYFQSFYYDPPQGLTLHVDKAQWLDKNAPRVKIDLTTGEADGLPDGVDITNVTRSGQHVEIEFLSPPARGTHTQSFDGAYWDPMGGEHNWNRWAGGTRYSDGGAEMASYEIYFLEDYPWDTVELAPSYTKMSQYEEPVSVKLF